MGNNKEFNLKDKIKNVVDDSADKTDIWDSERWGKTRKLLIKGFSDINKEFIKLLKEELIPVKQFDAYTVEPEFINKIIDKLAGESK